jgi:hypothetical protein
MLVAKIPYMSDVRAKNSAFYCYERALHVFNEAKRVHDFATICRNDEMD